MKTTALIIDRFTHSLLYSEWFLALCAYSNIECKEYYLVWAHALCKGQVSTLSSSENSLKIIQKRSSVIRALINAVEHTKRVKMF